MKPLIIGLAGRAGSGKSTCASWLVERHGAVEHSFARPVKSLTRELFDLTEEQVNGTQAQKEAIDPRWGQSGRQLMNKVGDAARRHVADDIWIRGVLRAIEQSTVRIAVISDVRFPNEADIINRAGGVVIRLRCPDAQTSVDPNTATERGVDEIAAEHVTVELSIARSPDAHVLLREFAYAIYPHIADAVGVDDAIKQSLVKR